MNPTLLRRAVLRPLIQRRFVSVSTASSTPSSSTVSTSVKASHSGKKSRSQFGSGLIGFLLGGTIVGAVGWYEFLDDYRYASRTLLESVEELESSTRKVRDYARKIEAVEATLRRLENQSVTEEALNQLRQEMRTLMDSNEENQYAWRGRIVDIEKDINALLKSARRV
ncbi:hypothetical protein THASP1DRAFT_22239 [Thamnocephalis sphaerospora]|uniref:Uncharacterized protein n=1 Tax=Thamnocephalis sphaerospora TaxID=78915 RepID=A0A4P9XWJ0_9FUNG|nr:hypothetical protein THASP1DRAFT_22239 [Thamnocephalis sphaerospora]|eukprot:RKP09971.1 hypothetical protein THASP1DRAFT_22239 [Thamnocephalis sphaerospora]